ncbi:CFI-box-CTERM domain-containing protein [Velocimicrobium porci]|uniref:Uncharacterized protein n=1 Tax=Velocimicrobium porci TaxID=2606634 RepID=A0A6L5XYR0_9FIRM|nr:CFI-box-CTERM domain-containing protein [Velocimicrobium porci]MSS63759.1 hypothetical protein [Velocimicrobium porci]
MDYNEKEKKWIEEYQDSLEHVGEMITAHMDLMKYFKAKTYEDAFGRYLEACRPILESLEHRVVLDAKHRDDYIEEMAKQFVYQLSVDSKGKRKKGKLEQYKIILALYTVPMIQELRLDISEDFVKKVHEFWGDSNPEFPFQIGTYSELKEGFRKKQFCYITTAVCEYQNKDDDCYELTMFRRFRDTYLREQENGEALIEEYYEFAPQIIKQIEFIRNEDEVYPLIWSNYLQPCLRLIETGDYEACFMLYKGMVNTLKERYCVCC